MCLFLWSTREKEASVRTVGVLVSASTKNREASVRTVGVLVYASTKNREASVSLAHLKELVKIASILMYNLSLSTSLTVFTVSVYSIQT